MAEQSIACFCSLLHFDLERTKVIPEVGRLPKRSNRRSGWVECVPDVIVHVYPTTGVQLHKHKRKLEICNMNHNEDDDDAHQDYEQEK